MDISVVTITKRWGGVDVAVDALKRQNFEGLFEWILVDEHYSERRKEVGDYVKAVMPNTPFTHTPPKMRKTIRKYGLINALNTGLLRARGELIVWLQDYIWCIPTALDRYWKAYDAFPHRLIGGLKDHYSWAQPDDPKGKVSLWSKPWEGDPEGKAILTERDDRYKSIKAEPDAVLVESIPIVYEMCNASMPYALAVALNGADEAYDNGRGYDNQNVSFRATGLGYQTVIDMHNIAREFNHWEWFGLDDKVSPPSVGGKPAPDTNYELHGRTMQAIRDGKYPLRAPNDFALTPLGE